MRGDVRRLLAWLCVCAPACCLLARPTLAGPVGVNFTGTQKSHEPAINNNGTQGFSFIPPDTMGAIGGSGTLQFAEILNGSFAVYNPATGALLAPRKSNAQFFIDAGITGLDPTTVGTGTLSGLTDPHIIYDSASQRWFAVAVDVPTTVQTNRVCVAVSTTPSAAGAWKGVAYPATAQSNYFADFPMLGMNGDSLVISTNNFPDPTAEASANATLTLLPKADLLLATPSVGNRRMFDAVAFTDSGASPHAAVDLDNTGNTLPVLSDFNTLAGKLKRSEVVNTATPASASFDTVSRPPITAETFLNPTPARQPGGPDNIETDDPRFSGQVIVRNGKIWAVQNVRGSNGLTTNRWVRIDKATNTLEASGLVPAPSSTDTYFGSIMVNDAGDVVIGYTQSSSTQVPTPMAVVGKYNAGAGTTAFGVPFSLANATLPPSGNYNVVGAEDNENRWGDYSQTTLDPTNPKRFWTIQEYVAGNNNWATEISQIVIGNSDFAVSVGIWANISSWAGSVPNGVDDVANFGTHNDGQRTAVINAPVTIGTMNFTPSTGTYTIQTFNSSTITLDVSSGQAAINVTGGNHAIFAPIVLNDDSVVTIAPGRTLSVQNLRRGASATASLVLNSGTLKLNVNGSANNAAGTSVVSGLSIAPGAVLDLTNNSMVIDYAGASPQESVRLAMKNGQLITSSVTPAGARLGYGEASAVLPAGSTSFAGVSFSGDALLIKFTYGGDTNLDGKVDVTDLGALATNWQTSNVWTGGDFSYDGFVDVTDLGMLATNWQKGVSSPLGPTSFQAALASIGLSDNVVPEPGALLAVFSSVLLLHCMRHLR